MPKEVITDPFDPKREQTAPEHGLTRFELQGWNPNSIIEIRLRPHAGGFNGDRPDLGAYVPALPGNNAIGVAPFGKKHFALAFNLEGESQALSGFFDTAAGEHTGNLQGHPAIRRQTSRRCLNPAPEIAGHSVLARFCPPESAGLGGMCRIRRGYAACRNHTTSQ